MNTYGSGNRVGIVAGQLTGHVGAVIKDERLTDHFGLVARDRVWVLLDAGDNPQHFTHSEIAEVTR